jgi:DNA-binding NarL/FixJ family response regulator
VLSIGMPDMSPIELDDKIPVRQRESCVVSDSDDPRAHQSAPRYGARSTLCEAERFREKRSAVVPRRR